jgi:hypothetical protein
LGYRALKQGLVIIEFASHGINIAASSFSGRQYPRQHSLYALGNRGLSLRRRERSLKEGIYRSIKRITHVGVIRQRADQTHTTCRNGFHALSNQLPRINQ